jgi:hypothetical protein
LSGHDWEAVKNTRFTIRVEGTLFYENGFGDKVGQSFCQSFVNDSFTVRGTTYGGAAFYPCDHFQSMLDNAKRMKAAYEQK